MSYLYTVLSENPNGTKKFLQIVVCCVDTDVNHQKPQYQSLNSSISQSNVFSVETKYLRISLWLKRRSQIYETLLLFSQWNNFVSSWKTYWPMGSQNERAYIWEHRFNNSWWEIPEVLSNKGLPASLIGISRETPQYSTVDQDMQVIQCCKITLKNVSCIEMIF